MFAEVVIERIIREEVRNYLFGGTANKQRKRKPVERGHVNLASDPSVDGLTQPRKDSFVGKVADLRVNKFLEFKVPRNQNREVFVKRIEGNLHYSRKRTGYTLISERQEDGIRIYRTA